MKLGGPVSGLPPTCSAGFLSLDVGHQIVFRVHAAFWTIRELGSSAVSSHRIEGPFGYWESLASDKFPGVCASENFFFLAHGTSP